MAPRQEHLSLCHLREQVRFPDRHHRADLRLVLIYNMYIILICNNYKTLLLNARFLICATGSSIQSSWSQSILQRWHFGKHNKWRSRSTRTPWPPTRRRSWWAAYNYSSFKGMYIKSDVYKTNWTFHKLPFANVVSCIAKVKWRPIAN